jgi:hypothetical protein
MFCVFAFGFSVQCLVSCKMVCVRISTVCVIVCCIVLTSFLGTRNVVPRRRLEKHVLQSFPSRALKWEQSGQTNVSLDCIAQIRNAFETLMYVLVSANLVLAEPL